MTNTKLIKFAQTNCNPCVMLANYIKYEKGVEVDQDINLSVAGDEELELAGQYGIMKTPTLLLVDEDGKELSRVSGVDTEAVDDILKMRGLI